MNAGRWRTPTMPAHYIRNETAGRGAVAQFHGYLSPCGLSRGYFRKRFQLMGIDLSWRVVVFLACGAVNHRAPLGIEERIKACIIAFIHAFTFAAETADGTTGAFSPIRSFPGRYVTPSKNPLFREWPLIVRLYLYYNYTIFEVWTDANGLPGRRS